MRVNSRSCTRVSFSTTSENQPRSSSVGSGRGRETAAARSVGRPQDSIPDPLLHRRRRRRPPSYDRPSYTTPILIRNGYKGYKQILKQTIIFKQMCNSKRRRAILKHTGNKNTLLFAIYIYLLLQCLLTILGSAQRPGTDKQTG